MTDSAKLQVSVPGGCVVCECPSAYCEYSVRDLIWDHPTVYEFVRCQQCGHGSLHPQPSPSQLQELYAGLYTQQKLDLMIRIGAGRFDRSLQRGRIRAIKSAMSGLCVSSMLDVGCGVGFFVQRLAQAFPKAVATGIEVAGPAAQQARRLCGDAVEIIEQSFLDSTLAPQSIDVLCMNHLLEHLSDPSVHMQRAAEMVRCGGIIVIEVPQLHGWARTILGPWFWCHLPPQHLHLYSVEGLRHLLSTNGFDEIVNLSTTGYPFNITVGFVMYVRHTVGSRSPRSQEWWIRAPAVLVGLLLLPMVVCLDVLAGFFLNRTRGDILRIVARRSSRK